MRLRGIFYHLVLLFTQAGCSTTFHFRLLTCKGRRLERAPAVLCVHDALIATRAALHCSSREPHGPAIQHQERRYEHNRIVIHFRARQAGHCP